MNVLLDNIDDAKTIRRVIVNVANSIHIHKKESHASAIHTAEEYLTGLIIAVQLQERGRTYRNTYNGNTDLELAAHTFYCSTCYSDQRLIAINSNHLFLALR